MSKDFACPDCGCIISSDLMAADKQRRRFFAAIRDSFDTMPDHHRARFPSSEVLRKHALIAAGWCDVMTVVAGSKAAAPGIAAAFQHKDRYCVAIVRGDVVIVSTARSMSRRSLLRPQFREIADKAFAWIEATTGVDPAKSYERMAA